MPETKPVVNSSKFPHDLNSLEQTGNRLSALGRGLGVVGAVVGSAATLGMLAKTSVELAKSGGRVHDP